MKSYVVEKEFKYKGLKCVVLLLSRGYRCGYVGVPKGHPLYNVAYMDCMSFLLSWRSYIFGWWREFFISY